jgi:hypothetical protein
MDFLYLRYAIDNIDGEFFSYCRFLRGSPKKKGGYGNRRNPLFVPLADGLRIFRHSSSFASTVPDEVAPIVTGDLAMQVLGRYELLRLATRATPEAGSPLSPLRAG